MTGGIDGIIRIFDMNTFTTSIKLPQLPDLITGLRLAPDGGYLYLYSCVLISRLSHSLDAGLRVWDVNSYFEGESRCLKLMQGHTVSRLH